MGLEVLERERVEPDRDRIAPAHHELGKLVTVAAQHRLLIDEDLLHDSIAEPQPGGRQGPEGRADRARVGDRDAALPLGREQALHAPELALPDLIDVDEDPGRAHEREGVREVSVAVEEAGVEAGAPVRVVLGLRRHDHRPHGIPDAGRLEHLERGAHRHGRHVPGVHGGLALLDDPRRELDGFEIRVLELDLRIGLREELEDAGVALAGEGVDRDLALLPGGGGHLLPFGRDGRGVGETTRRSHEPGGAGPRGGAQQVTT